MMEDIIFAFAPFTIALASTLLLKMLQHEYKWFSIKKKVEELKSKTQIGPKIRL